MISYKSFLAEQNECVPVHTHRCQRGADSQPGAGVWNCSEGTAAECYHSTLAKEEWAEIAYQLRGSVQGGLQAQPAGGLQPGAAQILTGSSAARRISKWELKGIDISATHCKEKRQTTAETKPKEEQLKDQPKNSLKPCQKSSLTTEQVRTAAVANAAANTHSTLEGRDSSFSPALEGTSSGTDVC